MKKRCLIAGSTLLFHGAIWAEMTTNLPEEEDLWDLKEREVMDLKSQDKVRMDLKS